MRIIPLLAYVLVLAGCNAPADQPAEESTPAAEATAEADAAEAAESPEATPTPEELALVNTAWRVTGEDGAIYTTFFDAEGAYRDTKNGDPWADGAWERLADGRLCFEPSDEGRTGACWTLGKHKKDGTMRVTDDSGREVLLQQVTYLAPVAEAEG